MISVKKFGFGTALCGVMALAAPYAQAGFQFTPPSSPAPQAQALPPLQGGMLPSIPDILVEGEGNAPTSMPAAPRTPVESEAMADLPPLEPAPTNTGAAESWSTPPQNGASSSSTPTGLGSLGAAAMINQQPLEPMTAAAPAPTASPAPTSNFDMAVGFGQDLPLVTALEQVVPADYTYVLNDSVPMSSPVSWEGGQPWPTVLGNMLAPLGLRADISGNKVAIHSGAPSAPLAPLPTIDLTAGNSAMAQPAPLIPMASAPPRSPSMPSDEMQPGAAFKPPAQGAITAYPGTAQPAAYINPPAPVAKGEIQPTPVHYAPPPAQAMPVSAHGMTAASVPPAGETYSNSIPQTTRGTWRAEKGDSLRAVMESWAGQAGANLFWSSDYDFPLAGEVNLSGSFEDAVESLLRGFDEARPKPIARLHPNLPHGPAVLVVETRNSIE